MLYMYYKQKEGIQILTILPGQMLLKYIVGKSGDIQIYITNRPGCFMVGSSYITDK